MKIVFLTVLVLFMIPLSSALATVQNIGTDKSSYVDGDQIQVTGSVEYNAENPFVVIQVWVPNGSNMADFTTVPATPSGSFSSTFVAGGPLWSTEGQYKIVVSYLGDKMEKSINFTIPVPEPETQTEPTPSTIPEEPQPVQPSIPQQTPQQTPEPKPKVVYLKEKIPDFPSLENSPQYYIDRYNTEPTYKAWFDSQFPSNTISQVVGYEATHIDGFPSLEKPPQYYIDRYNTEPTYKAWFDSQFPNSSIYNILGFSDPVPVPEWIKRNAGLWAQGGITDGAFIAGIEFLIDEKILVIPDLPESGASTDDDVPNWVRNNANWWALGQISEDEFINALKFLIREGIISVKQ